MIRLRRLMVCLGLILLGEVSAQQHLFDQEVPLKIGFAVSLKNMLKNTNDSTYLKVPTKVEGFDSLEIKMRARGNFRRNQCYYPPLKWKIGKKRAKGTLFENNRKLKLVLPCLIGQGSDDEVLEEYLAYRMYESLATYHFKTRLVRVNLEEIRGNRSKSHQLIGFLIEDDSQMLKRINGQKAKAKIHPLQHDGYTSTVNSFFQYLIANTDYSVRSQHNNKLVYVDGKIMHIPYDFDMSGLVNAPYATISGTQNLSRKITQVTQRVYKGYKRESLLMDSVRNYFITKKPKLFSLLEAVKAHFKKAQNYTAAKKFIESFYAVIEDEKKYQKFILKEARVR